MHCPTPRPKTPPEPKLISACTFCRPAPVGSFQGSRKVSRRSRRYGDDQAAIAASATRCRRRGEQAHPRARDEQDRADDEEERERRAEVGLDEHENREEPDDAAERAAELLERFGGGRRER